MGESLKNVKIEEKIPLAVARFVEYKIRTYPEHKAAIEAWESEKEDIPHQVKQWDPNSGYGSGVSDPTSAKVVRMLLLEEKADRESFWVRGIEDVIDALSEADRELVRLKYFEGYLSNAGVARALHISEREFYRRRDEILGKMARRFGLM